MSVLKLKNILQKRIVFLNGIGMLQEKVTISRSKLSACLLQCNEQNTLRRSLATSTRGQHGETDTKTKVLYDGECPLCMIEINFLKSYLNKDNKVSFVDITKGEYRPQDHMGITFQEAMGNMHVIGPDKQIHSKMDGVRALYRGVGLGWLASLTELPVIKDTANMGYDWFAANRHRLKGQNREECINDRCQINTQVQKSTVKDKV